MVKTELVVLQDRVADALDDMAALGAHWARNRERAQRAEGVFTVDEQKAG